MTDTAPLQDAAELTRHIETRYHARHREQLPALVQLAERVHLESDLAFSGEAPLKTYAAEGEALGSSVRWVTASDQEPIAEATAQALHQLATQIEQDREFVIKATHR